VRALRLYDVTIADREVVVLLPQARLP